MTGFALDRLDELTLYNAADVLPEDLEDLGLRPRLRFEARRATIESAARLGLSPLKQLMLYDQQTFMRSILDRNDRMAMAASIECRVTFLATPLVETSMLLLDAALFDSRRGKLPLRLYAADLLPEEVLGRPNWGFGIPWDRYLRDDPSFRDFLLSLPESGLAAALGAPGLARLVRSFATGDDRRGSLVRQLFALGVWWEQVVEGRGDSVADAAVAPRDDLGESRP